MGIWVVQQFSVREADRAQCLTALAAIAEHIKTDHSEVLAVRTRTQWIGSQAHRGIVWEEHFESLVTMEGGNATQTCADVWAPVHALALPGTHMRSVLIDGSPSWRRTVQTPAAPTTIVEEEIVSG